MKSENENPLETLLRLAANEPAHRPEFLRTLLDSTVYVLGETETEGEGSVTLQGGSKVKIQHWEKQDGMSAIPFFTSLEILQKSIRTEQSYLALPTRSLFEMTQGENLVLNPGSSYGKEFFAEEVRHLLAHGLSREP